MSDKKPFLVPVVIDDTRERGASVPDKFHEVQWTCLPDGNATPAFVERIRSLLLMEPTQAPIPTPEQAVPAVPATQKPTIPPWRSKPVLIVMVTGLALVTIGYFALERLMLPKHPATPSAQATAAASNTTLEKSIAVLPFLDLSEKRDQEYFSDGLTEELIDRLTHEGGLKVIARTSAFQFKGRYEDVRLIAGKLGVANLLEGSVRKSGMSLRITAQLIKAADGTHLWSQTYDRRLTDIFSVQSEIAETVAEALKGPLHTAGDSGQIGPLNQEAYDLVLQGNFFIRRNTKADVLHSIELYKRATTVEPGYALAWAKVAAAYSALPWYEGFSALESEPQARAAVAQALQVDPNSAYAHHVLANILELYEWDWKGADREFDRARALNPNDPGLRADYAYLRAILYHSYSEAIEAQKSVIAHDPLDSGAFSNLGGLQLFAGQLTDAEACYRKSLELNPKGVSTRYFLAQVLLLERRFNEGLAVAEQEPDAAWRLSILPMIYWQLGRREESNTALSILQRDFADQSAYQIAELHAYRGNGDGAFTWLEKAYATRDIGLSILTNDPLLRSLHKDGRYVEFRRKLNLPD
jgi:TolB-like protein/Tfp pilus assembly protein PilF